VPRPKFTHRLEYGAYRLIESSLRLLSVLAAAFHEKFLGRLAVHILPKYRRIVLRNLRFAYGEAKSPEEIEELLHEVFERNGGNLLSSIRLPLLSDDEILKHITFEGADLIEKNHALGKGTLIIAPHMGNWELLAQALPLLKPDALAGAFYRKLNNPLMDQLIENRRKRRGIHLFAKHDSSHKLTAFLRKNGGLGILGDQRVGERGHPVVFFGRPTTFSPLPELLEKRTDAALMGMHCRSSGPDQWTVTLTEIKNASAQSCADNLEKAWRSSPADVFWFQDRWRLTGRRQRPLSFLNRTDHLDQQRIIKPLRFVHLHSASSEKPPSPWAPQLVTLEHRQIESELDLHTIIEEDGPPIDTFIVSGFCMKKLSKNSKRIPFFSAQELSSSEPAAL